MPLILRGVRGKHNIDVSLEVPLLNKMTDRRTYFITKLTKVNKIFWWISHIREKKWHRNKKLLEDKKNSMKDINKFKL